MRSGGTLVAVRAAAAWVADSAWGIGELELARRSLERATQRWSSINSKQNSPYHAVLVRFHLADVLSEMGDRTTARAGYEAFLRCWSDPDRPIPEITAARWLLDYLVPAASDAPTKSSSTG